MGNESRKATHSSTFSRNLWSGFLFGLGLAAFLDETLFHQILRWHHFYDKSTTDIGIISDGLFHAFSWFATVGGLFIVADLRRRRAFLLKGWWSGTMLGAGGFQLYDGTIHHKVLKIHQIRYVENVFIYDLIWHIIAVAIIVIGILLVFSSRKEAQQKGASANEQ